MYVYAYVCVPLRTRSENPFRKKGEKPKKKEEGEEENGIQGNVDNAVCCASHEFGSLRSKIASENAAIQLLPATLQSRGLLAKEEA